MERIHRQNAKSANTQRPAQAKFTSESRENELAKSPMMAAQRVKLQSLFGRAAQLKGPEEEPLQGKFTPIQRVEEEESVQGKFATTPSAQREEALPSKPNNTGLPDNLKSGIESLSGMSMDNVKVHYNSSQPAQLNALAYAQGTDIHVAPGQEQHLPHEAWHVVQQAQGRVKPTMQMKEGVPVNDDHSLEHEADVMGAKAVSAAAIPSQRQGGKEGGLLQGKFASQYSGKSASCCLQWKQSLAVVQRVSDFDFSYNDYAANENDDHGSGGLVFPTFPKKGMLTGETEAKYEQKLEKNTFRYNTYYGLNPEIQEESSSSGKTLRPLRSNRIKKLRFSPYQNPMGIVKKSLRMRMLNGKKLMTHSDLFAHEFAQNLIGGTKQMKYSDSPIQFALKSIKLRSTGATHDFDYALGPNYNINFSANTAAGNYDPVDHGSLVDLETGCAVAKHGITKSGMMVQIAPNGSRAQHFSIADRLDPAAAAKRPGTWTWHHLDTQYQMVLVDSAVHNPGYGGFFHYGGMAFWV